MPKLFGLSEGLARVRARCACAVLRSAQILGVTKCFVPLTGAFYSTLSAGLAGLLVSLVGCSRLGFFCLIQIKDTS
jgi:MFS superfamily sulfate permease-like transporter